MLVYLLKSILCLLLLFSFYKLLLEDENCHRFKRFYLLAAVIFSVIIPQITLTYEVNKPVSSSVLAGSQINSSSNLASEPAFWDTYGIYILIAVYLAGFAIFAFRFAKNLSGLYAEARSNERLEQFRYIFVLLRKKLDPHSFLNFIFLNKSEFEDQKISEAVLEHEKAHVDQKHTLDLLFIEICQVIFWFNPVFHFLKRSVKLNHEFLADEQVLKGNIEALDYTNVLYSYGSGMNQNSLASPISHSLIKKRIIMITNQFSRRRFTLRLLILLPVLGGCVFLFNEKIVARNINESNLVFQEQQERKVIKIKVEGETIWLNGEKVDLNEFTEKLDQVTSSWTKAEMQKPWFKADFQNSTTPFINKLNGEYQRSKLAQVSQTEFIVPRAPKAPEGELPPPPPPPVKAKDTKLPAPPPPPAQPSETKNIPSPPPPPPAPEVSKENIDSLRMVVQEKREQLRDEMVAKRTELRAEMEERRNVQRNIMERHRDSLRNSMEEVRLARIEEERSMILEKREEMRKQAMDEKRLQKEQLKRLKKEQKLRDSLN
ncbi:M56 family metallopeptidase [Christiangramia oceanisediminis]|uniref:M56 family metallopeptidase n=1 Tax=Christiangramia oceanisediminis TaxID=2920386 RepID=UPI0024354E74|nr:M56 family metallopeptidase [Gramella oceanisediminis]